MWVGAGGWSLGSLVQVFFNAEYCREKDRFCLKREEWKLCINDREKLGAEVRDYL